MQRFQTLDSLDQEAIWSGALGVGMSADALAVRQRTRGTGVGRPQVRGILSVPHLAFASLPFCASCEGKRVS